MPIRYPDLRPEQDAKGRVQWSYADGKKRTKLYAGKVTNNVVQGTARCVMTDGMLRVAKRYPVVGTVHDELLAVAPKAEADEAKTWVLAQMVMEPRYLPGIPLNADVGAHERYGLAKA
jgi:DNA polymerase I-like protein with 3'-5' exonuclease and polymerase domains